MNQGFRHIITKKDGQVLVITINRPDVMNAINEELSGEITQALDQARTDNEVRVLVLTGAGRAFCAGGQLKGPDREAFFAAEKPEEIRQALMKIQEIVRSLARTMKPTIAMVNGPAMGAGFGIALACDIRIASEKAKFAESFTKIGVIPGTGDTWFLPRLVGLGKAAEIVFTGDTIDAAEALRLGIVNRVVPSESLEEETMALARKIAQGPPIALRLNKMLLYRGLSTDLDGALDTIAAAAPITALSADKNEGIAAFEEKRQPRFRGE